MPSTVSSISLLQPVPPADGVDANTQHIDLGPSTVAVERLFGQLSRSSAVLRALRDFDSAALDIKQIIKNLAGGDARIQLLQNYYVFLNDARLRTFVLRISGKKSGAVAEVPQLAFSIFVLPADAATLHSLPAQKFIQWVRAFERREFGVPDAITPAQREMLVDFAQIWEGFARLPRLDHGWEYFRPMLRWLANESWMTNLVVEDGGFVQLAMLSEWARDQYPTWFEDPEVDPEMPELVTMYGSSDESNEDYVDADSDE
ncbi:hypothetical protein OH76DRAFT_1490512 [Lentinus brumalis]|uniref:Uncharacterized protein n=1 Tax=Lentinus brumalis TaxID=2498619 RepID=A0A371CIT1_9APHY|nr:hypothetical protein OH76DRAFT_1490512 [Polyporus brumalis]